MNSVYENPWFKVVKDGKYHYLIENGSDNGAIVLAIVAGQFVFVRVSRPAHGRILIEAPRGYGKDGETSESCAVREFLEETGHKFDEADLKKIGEIRPNSAILASVIPVYLIESNSNEAIKRPDEEVLGVTYIQEEDIYKEIAKGNITDGFTLSAISLYWSRNHNKKRQADA